ncbi:hypothetical protein GCM10027275_02130 [Rhabdobacter roseus]|uniref:Outer membrane protein beta-barrel domain-containing protein n=1 Tax=Rhabdobacter roseus TaxID=1655419 RepID=A0A840TPX2_9BACT|nr:outer membrane beta-barrel protein [Rhabdobacter roseus]MBB5282100.1 hypothetical protein [Rhabdobacter roseus]
MNQSGKQSFEEEWRRALEDASEAPPPGVWSKIEAQLDENETKVVPLLPQWWRSPRLWYAAAAIGALLLVSWPLWDRSEKDGQNRSQVARSGREGKGVDTSTSAEPAAPSGTPPLVSAPRLAESPEVISSEASTQAEAVKQRALAQRLAATPRRNGAADKPNAQEQPGTSGTLASQVPSWAAAPEVALGPADPSARPGSAALLAEDQPATASEQRPEATAELAFLSPRAIRELPVHTQKRYVYYRYEVEDEVVPEVSGKKQQLWAGLGLMPAAYNPNVQVTSPPSAFTAANASRQSVSNNSSNAGLSYALQTQAGIKLSKHWSIESGISYLRGNSSFQSSGYVLDGVSNRSANVLENAILANASRSNDYNSFAPSMPNYLNLDKVAAFYIDLDQQTRNDYRFIQLPVHAGYTINPEGKLSYTVLGGMVANVFLRNDLEGASGYTLTNTASDDIYRPLNWSAGTGLRVNYRFSTHWGANLTGAYQHALSSGLQDNSTIQSRPQLYGLSWGVRYSF